jgi:RNA-directed DNA polymerase
VKRLANLWPQVVTFDNLYLAWRKARLGKRNRKAVAAFSLNLEKELLSLQKALCERSYQPGSYRLFKLYERKPRIIAAAPFRDRVVHHSLMNVVEPLLDRSFIYDSYACRKGKGVHSAVDRYQIWARRYRYAMKMDVFHYFPSIDHALLKAALCRRIKDPDVLWLFEVIIDSSPDIIDQVPQRFPGDDLLTPLERRVGIPIGNLPSQFFANLYLDELDHFIKEHLKVRSYLRYVDDLIFLGDDKSVFNPSVQSWIGHACHADTWGLRRAIFRDTVFRRRGRTMTNAV